MKSQGCVSCKKTVHNDREATSLCAWCEMPLEKSSTLVWRQDNEHYTFCSKQCLQSFQKGGIDGA